ncbi:MAG: XRE family transcriptional regulator [Puniceicoccaceae bacterium]|nr:helix-turn-helix domain-containing protein [Opitutales bacterium]TVP82070.1 MAG: XRE family transcriptional regulator [Puniceicoccaceae bacterium]
MPSKIPRSELKPELKRFGDNLRRERVKRHLTQEQTAERAEIALRTLQKIEAGQINILVTTARRLREAIGCPWKKLMD